MKFMVVYNYFKVDDKDYFIALELNELFFAHKNLKYSKTYAIWLNYF